MIEAPLDLQSSLSIPADHLQACTSQNLPVSGNAAGNTKNVFDLQGENLPPARLPAGFTARGVVALIFSCLSAFLGLAVIIWYGASEIESNKVSPSKGDITTMMRAETVG
ncbi:hypothetical protein MMC12_008666, partial [Toensbergia leucococca]|nr:hypothetical protein [Toensbergia leucococca]